MALNRLIQHNKTSVSWHIYRESSKKFENMETFFCLQEDEELMIVERGESRYQLVVVRKTMAEAEPNRVLPLADFPVSQTIIMYEDNIETQNKRNEN